MKTFSATVCRKKQTTLRLHSTTALLRRVSAPVLFDDIDYVEPSSKKDGPQGVPAPVLDDMDVYVPNNSKKGAPQGVSAPVLDDDNYTAGHSKKDGPQGVTAPILDESRRLSAKGNAQAARAFR